MDLDLDDVWELAAEAAYLDLLPPQEPCQPSVVEGLIEFPDLAMRLEHITSSPHGKVETLRGTWYEDSYIKIAHGLLMIKDLAACNPHQVKLVLAHLPGTRVGACTYDLGHPFNDMTLATLATFLPDFIVIWRQPRGASPSALVAKYEPGKLVCHLQFEPYE